MMDAATIFAAKTRAARRIVAAAALASFAVAGHTDTPTTAKLPPKIDAAGLKRELGRRTGKVVVVNFWATWCDPCKAEFPDLAKLAAANKSKGMDLITVSFDDTAGVAKSVVPFLAKTHIGGTPFVNKTGSHFDDAYLTYLEPKLPEDDAVGLPRTYIFDRKGNLAKVLIGGQSFAQFEAAVEGYL